MRISVTRDGKAIQGTIVSMLGDDQMEVVTDAGEKFYLGRDDSIEVLKPEAQPEEVRQGGLPPEASPIDTGAAVIVSDIGGVDVFDMPPDLGTVAPIGSAAQPQPEAPLDTPSEVEEEEEDEASCLVVRPQGGRRPSTYHSRTDCGKVEDRETMGLTEEQVQFLDLSLCSFCSRKDSQISFAEALADELSSHGISADEIQSAIDSLTERYEFAIRPDAVDRDE